MNHTGKFEDDRPDVEKVACSDPAAMGKVVAKVAGTGQYASELERSMRCRGYPETEFVYTTGEFTLCLISPR
ncbi:LppU/SCO3897 family protein [Nocardia lasii]|uniref:Uncharacterized protein n=1 Tax=Nocardia lasii TaxID=1616107 RepID=A0ABW1JRP0_9NOCA